MLKHLYTPQNPLRDKNENSPQQAAGYLFFCRAGTFDTFYFTLSERCADIAGPLLIEALKLRGYFRVLLNQVLGFAPVLFEVV